MFHLFAHGALGHAQFLCGASETVVPCGDFKSLQIGQGRAKTAHGKRGRFRFYDKPAMSKRNSLRRIFRLRKPDTLTE
ncbi:Uncharacterised protein [Bordetella pertussis]|nr:Uncharacterised protein [Bordetella pertussis]